MPKRRDGSIGQRLLAAGARDSIAQSQKARWTRADRTAVAEGRRPGGGVAGLLDSDWSDDAGLEAVSQNDGSNVARSCKSLAIDLASATFAAERGRQAWREASWTYATSECQQSGVYTCPHPLPAVFLSDGRGATHRRDACAPLQHETTRIMELTVATANVCTLCPRTAGGEHVEGLLCIGRSALLEDVFSKNHLDIVGIQEARLPGNQDKSGRHYRMISSGATADGTHGVQVWLRLRSNFSVKHVVPLDHRILMAVVQVGDVLIIVVVGHCPVEGDEEATAGFWRTLVHEYAKLNAAFGKPRTLWLVDANGRCGSVRSEFVGTVGDESETVNGFHLRVNAEENELYVANSFFDAGATHTGSRGHKRRIDYILCCQALFQRIKWCSCLLNIDLSTAVREDHHVLAACILVDLRPSIDALPADTPSSLPRLKICPNKLNSGEFVQAFQAHMARFRQNHTWNVDQHLAFFTDHIRDGAKCFEPDKSTPKKPWISWQTWQLVKYRLQARKVLRSGTHALLHWWRAAILRTWRSHVTIARHGSIDISYSCNINLLFDQAMDTSRWHDRCCALLAYVSLAVKCALRLDKKSYIDFSVARADRAARCGDSKTTYRIVKSLSGYRPQRMKSVKDETGNVVSYQHGYDDRWIRHFTQVLSAEIVETIDDLGVREENAEDSNILLPSFERTFELLQRMPDGKGVGTDGIPGELIKAGGHILANSYWKLSCHAWRKCYVPLQWRGGRLCELFKKGDSLECDNYRGLLVSDHLSKPFVHLIDDHVEPYYDAHMPTTQCGATKLRGTDIANHFVRTILDLAALRGLSVAVLYVDLTKAFDTTVREQMMGMPQGFVGCPLEYMRGIGVDDEAARHIVDALNQDGPVLQQLGVHEHVIGLVRSLHTKSWFKFGASPKLIVAKKGGRQGCRFGGKCFNFNYAVALLGVRGKLLERGVAIRIVDASSASAADGLQARRFALSPIDDATAVIDITFVDDEAVTICAAVPSTLCKHVDYAIKLIVDVFAKFNFIVNFAKGKTELMVKFRGKNSKSTRDKMLQGDKYLWPLPDDVRARTGAHAIHVVDIYKHLGSVVEISGSLMPEANARVRAAMNAYAPLAGKVFGSPRVNWERKLLLAWSLVFSRLFFNIHVWSKFEGKPRQTLHSMYMRVLRRILGQPRYAAGGITDRLVRTSLGALSIDCIARRARLKYIARLVRSGTHVVLNLVMQWSDGNRRLPWMDLLINDFEILRAELPKIFVDCPLFGVDPNFFFRMMRDCPVEWKCIVDAYQTPLNDTEVPQTQTVRANLRTASNVFACDVCGHGEAVFGSSKALQTHKRMKHGTRSSVIQYIPNTSVCPVCKVDFRSRLRLITHASESRARSKNRRYTCRDVILSGILPQLPAAELAGLNARDREARRAASKAGHSHEIARLPAKKPPNFLHILAKPAARTLCRTVSPQPVHRRILQKRKAPEYDEKLPPVVIKRRGR